MKIAWFKKMGWTYIPVHPAGVIITILAITFMMLVCIAITRNDHPAGDEQYEILYIAPVPLIGGNG
jgi:hypothetical protein